MGGTKSKKRGEGGREEETGGGTVETSGGGEVTEGGSKETDDGRGGATEAKRGGRHLSSRSRSTGGCHTGVKKKLVEENESGTSGVFIRGGDEFDRLTPLDEKATGLVSSQGDSGATPGARRNDTRVRNRANGWGKPLQKMCQLWHIVFATGPSVSRSSLEYFLADFNFGNATSCSPCARAKVACKSFDADGAQRKAKEETARRAQARKTEQRTDVE